MNTPLTLIPNPNGSSSSFPFSMRDLTPLRLSFFNLNYFHHHHHRHNFILHHRNSLSLIKPVSLALPSSPSMAEELQKTDKHPPSLMEEREKKPPKELPPPPEKPEPGDCCGSGCVRCVWDVYYEGLEAYNQMLKQLEESQSPSKS